MIVVPIRAYSIQKKARNAVLSEADDYHTGYIFIFTLYIHERCASRRSRPCLPLHLDNRVPNVAVRAISAHVNTGQQLLPDILLP